jgi:hypothetical protein
MKKKVAVFMVMVFTLVAFSSSAFAWSPKLEGRPDAFDPGDSRGYFIWHDEHGLHLRTTTRGQFHKFTGVIRTNGNVFDVRGVRMERRDLYAVDHRHDVISFAFDTAGDVDGLDFRIQGGSYVNFELYVDGHRMNTNGIYVGESGKHPRNNDFTLFR